MRQFFFFTALIFSILDGTQGAQLATKGAQAEVLNQLPFKDKQSFEDAAKGFMAPLPDEGIIGNAEGKVIWDVAAYDFIKQEEVAPDSVNPSLWRQAQLLKRTGLFKVADRIYQVRGADLSNITFIEGRTGIVVVDPLISAETAKAALDLYYKHRPKKPIVALIYTHSHVDHYGGAGGIVSIDDVKSGKVAIFAPDGFVDSALTENVLVGNAMSRRASYMYGNLIPKEVRGQVTAGLGLTTSTGTVTFLVPTEVITKPFQETTIDGLRFQFKLVPDTEAPAEMVFYLPDLKALCLAEDATHTMHNLYSLRGAKIRDSLKWSKDLNESLALWGGEAEVFFSVHHWPVWGKERIVDYIKKQRDTYKYIHDQTLRLANQGLTMTEIAEEIKLPSSLATNWSSRGYYGTLNQNVKSVYVKYLGWFDGNPATLHPYPPVESSRRYVQFMGGMENLLKQAQGSYDAGDYRFVVEVVNHAVFADPENSEAKKLQANALEQLGYQAESGPWRDFYLTGAKELRDGVDKGPAPNTASPDTIGAMPLEMLFDYLAIRLDGPRAEGKTLVLNLNFSDIREKWVVVLENSVLNYFPNTQAKESDATITLTRAAFNEVLLGQSTLEKKIASSQVKVEGEKGRLMELLNLLVKFNFWFNIVTP